MTKKESSKKRKYGTNQKRRNISLDDERAKKLEKIGGDNLSEGIRIVADAYNEKADENVK